MKFSEDELKNYINLYLLSNNAFQLYEWIRNDLSLQNLANNENKDLLVKEYNKRTDEEDRKIEDTVVAYTILVVFTLFPIEDAHELFSKVNLDRLDWGYKIKEIYFSNETTNQLVIGDNIFVEQEY